MTHKTPREWSTELLMAAPKPRDLEPDGRGIEPSRANFINIIRQIEDEVLERAANIAEQDPENAGRIAAALRAMKHYRVTK